MPLYLADTTVWAWANTRPNLKHTLAERMSRGELATCVPVALELLHTTRNGVEYEEMLTATLGPAAWLPLSDSAGERALGYQRRLAGGTTHGAHRLPSMDYLLVGVAAAAGSDVVVWHADRHLAQLCELAGQPHEHERVGRR